MVETPAELDGDRVSIESKTGSDVYRFPASLEKWVGETD